ncbi:MAG: hypothetical protein ACXAEU_20675 [Candidatus Hodarchaeales archaeon]|jgi:hypothetical protein
MVLKWDNQIVYEAEEEYNRLQIDPAQKQIVESMAGLLCQYVPLRKLAMKGFAWRAIIKWQQDNHRALRDLMTIDAEKRIIAAKQIFVILENFLKAVLHNKEKESVVEEAMVKAFDFYKTNYASR